MNCMNCGSAVGHYKMCPYCGSDLSVQVKAVQISDAFYNRGLEKAQIRDLSGAIDQLERSLKYNKRNIKARNLLGLVYFEVGEVVSALSEWIISKNLKPADNIASEYIEKLQSNPEKLDNINQSVKRYNKALEAVRDKNEDVAEIMLKKVLEVNPKLIKAYHLLAYLYMKDSQWEKARKVLKKALPIDRTNATTLRFVNEIDEQTGKETIAVEEKKKPVISVAADKIQKSPLRTAIENIIAKRKNKEPEKLLVDDELMYDAERRINDAETVQPVSFRDNSSSSILYIVLGIIMGALVIWFLVVPSVRQDASRISNEQVAELNLLVAKQTAELDEKESVIANYDIQANTTNQQLTMATNKSDAMESLVEAFNAYRGGQFDLCIQLLNAIDPNTLTLEAQTMRTNLINDCGTSVYGQYLTNGVTAYQNGNFTTAIEELNKAVAAKPDDYDAMSFLANAYRFTGQAEQAIAWYTKIMEMFPGTQRAESAQYYIALTMQENNIGTLSPDTFANTAQTVPEQQTVPAAPVEQPVLPQQ